jgi:hypothetical protein
MPQISTQEFERLPPRVHSELFRGVSTVPDWHCPLSVRLGVHIT